MKIELKEITVRDLSADYQGNSENGVVGYECFANKTIEQNPGYKKTFGLMFQIGLVEFIILE